MNLIHTVLPGNQTLTTKRYLFPPTLKTTRSPSMMLAVAYCFLIAAIEHQPARFASANHALSGPPASACLCQKAHSVFLAITRIQNPTPQTVPWSHHGSNPNDVPLTRPDPHPPGPSPARWRGRPLPRG